MTTQSNVCFAPGLYPSNERGFQSHSESLRRNTPLKAIKQGMKRVEDVVEAVLANPKTKDLLAPGSVITKVQAESVATIVHDTPNTLWPTDTGDSSVDKENTTKLGEYSLAINCTDPDTLWNGAAKPIVKMIERFGPAASIVLANMHPFSQEKDDRVQPMAVVIGKLAYHAPALRQILDGPELNGKLVKQRGFTFLAKLDPKTKAQISQGNDGEAYTLFANFTGYGMVQTRHDITESNVTERELVTAGS